MPRWIDEICDVLYKCKIPQIQKALIKEWYNDSGNIVIGKCAMGVLSCEAGRTLTPDMNENLIDDTANYYEIMKLYNVPEEWRENDILPSITKYLTEDDESDTFFTNIETCDYGYGMGEVIAGHNHLHQFIFDLNDAGLTFKEISECLKITFKDVEE